MTDKKTIEVILNQVGQYVCTSTYFLYNQNCAGNQTKDWKVTQKKYLRSRCPETKSVIQNMARHKVLI